jgi:GTP diphosphokinase / guanosine-3',5'-bis(diphosphate) 3'-diphosphatase
MTLELPVFENKVDYWAELKSGLNQDLNVELIKEAFDFADKAHYGQKRESGEPYVSHPVWIAKVVAQLGVGQEAIIAALLHDCVEDTSVTIDDIANEFGDEVALLVSGLTEVKRKTSGIEVHETNIDVFRKFLFSSVNDVRVLIIRLVDKLHNGLTIEYLTKERQIKYAKRVLGIYAPVAEYVGLHYFKRILEDISFKILYPEEAVKIEKKLKSRANEERKALILIKDNIKKLLDINNLHNYEVQSRIKSLYGTYLKAKRRPGDEAFLDRVGIRVITESVADCYTVLGLLHSTYNYIPEEFNDYISSPKPNGYRSLQTTLNWRDKLTAEVQIRTKEMHEFNEFGPASHIAYKLSKNVDNSMGFEWVRDLIKWQKNDKNINNYTINVLAKYIYVFTPKGDTIQLPAGSTALDFAYRIHGEIGNHCVGAKINQKMGKIDDFLKTGDMVEILTSKKVQRDQNSLK